MNRKSRIWKSCILGASCAVAVARADITINFESDAAGDFANGSSSVSSPLVSFSNGSSVEPMQILNSFTSSTLGQSLVVYPEAGGSVLTMNFTVPIYRLSLDFGNDQAGMLVTGSPGLNDLAVLNIYNGATLLDSVFFEPNANTAMDETIGWIYSGTGATRAEFFYSDSNFNVIDLLETVDNITFAVEVPEPSTYAAIGFVGGAAVLAWRRRKIS
jgi:hypothetical protein